MQGLIHPDPASVPEGSDTWCARAALLPSRVSTCRLTRSFTVCSRAILNGYVTVSPIRARSVAFSRRALDRCARSAVRRLTVASTPSLPHSFDQSGPEGLQLGSGAGAGAAIGVGREWLLDMPQKAGL